MADAPTRDDIGLALKLANEAGGMMRVGEMLERPPERLSYQVAVRCLEDGLVTATGQITPAGFRQLGDWLAMLPEGLVNWVWVVADDR
jgi:hypothetical protein